MKASNEENTPWICSKCGIKLEVKVIKVKYLNGNFEVDLMQCPKCKMVLIPKELALGKMVEVEKGLEDK